MSDRRAGPGRVLATGLAALALGAAGCDGGGEGTTPTTAPAPDGTGYFVGRSGDDVGASVDFGGFDAVSLALVASIVPDGRPDRPGVAVGIAAVVSQSSRTLPEPVFVGVRADGSTVALASARRALAGRDDPAARRARALMGPPGPLPPNGTRTIYLLLAGIRAAELAGVRMRVGVREPAELRRARR